MQLLGNAVTVIEQVNLVSGAGGDFDVADTGALVYTTGGAVGLVTPRTLVWVDRKGEEEQINVPVRA